MQTANEKNYIDKVVHYSTIARYMEKEDLTPILMELIKQSSTPLASIEKNFAIDASGFSTCRFKRWFDFKYGRERDFRVWIKANVMCGAKTNIVTAIKVSESVESDSKFFKELVQATAENFEVNEVSADKAYSSRKNLDCVNEVGGMAYIPFRSNATGKSRGSILWKKMYHYFMFNHEEFLEHYHKRSNVETALNMVKVKFGDKLKSKNFTAQKNELLCKFIAHNIVCLIHEMNELGIAPKFCSESPTTTNKVGGNT